MLCGGGPNQILIAGPTPGNVSIGAALGPVPGSGGVAIRVAISTADPSTFQAIVVSLCWKAPTIDQVTPPLLETKNGFGAPKLAAHICVGSIGSTPMLCSAFCAVSALALAGIRGTPRSKKGKLHVAVMNHSVPRLMTLKRAVPPGTHPPRRAGPCQPHPLSPNA